MSRTEPNVLKKRVTPEEIQKFMEILALQRENDPCHSFTGDPTSPFSKNDKGYIQVKGSALSRRFERNTKFTIHQLLLYEEWINIKPKVGHHRVGILYLYFECREWEKLEISHLCNNKRCTNSSHLWPEESEVNKSRNYCPVVIFIGSRKVPFCNHNPPCVITEITLQKARRFEVTAEDFFWSPNSK